MTSVHADELWLPAIFSEKMVLQRDMPIAVWGVATPGATVTVGLYQNGNLKKRLSEATAEAHAETGRWRLDLPSTPAQRRCAMLVVAQGPEDKTAQRRLFDNVMVGEVWITCGQSNAILPLEQCADYEDALARRNEYPLLRAVYIGVRDSSLITESQEQTHGYWGPAKWNDSSWLITRSSKTDAPGCQTGLSYFFARDLQEYLGKDVPVGMINIGAILPVETWVGPEEIEARGALHHLRVKGYPHATSRGYLANIAPLAPYTVRGVIYYQGEMNGSRCHDYYHGLQGLIASWRSAWQRKDMPFLIVQLPGFIEHVADTKHDLDMDAKSLAAYTGQNTDHSWCYIRDAQWLVSRADPNVGLAVTIDLGEPLDIHPPRKRPVAERLVLQARKLVYDDEDVHADAPTPTEYVIDQGAFTITFEGVGEGLVGKDELAGFELCDAAGRWHRAEATIHGARVRVKAPAVADPIGVRYAWKGYPPVTLYNKAGLPATPFLYPEADFKEQQFSQ